MSLKIHGITITLIDEVVIGSDPFGQQITEEKEIKVDNVIVAPASSSDVISQLDLGGRKIEYLLGIPKGDTNNWENKEVRFFGQCFKTFGIPEEGIEDLIPLEWNKKVMCELYE